MRILLLIAAGCAPAVPEITGSDVVVSQEGTIITACYVDEDGDGAVYPLTPDCSIPEGTPLDCDDSDPNMTAEECAETSGSPHSSQEEQYGWDKSWMIFDTEMEKPEEGTTKSHRGTWLIVGKTIFINGARGDLEHERLVLFTDGTWVSTENGWAEIDAQDPTAIFSVVDYATMEVVDPEVVSSELTIEMMAADYTDLGSMVLDSIEGTTMVYIP